MRRAVLALLLLVQPALGRQDSKAPGPAQPPVEAAGAQPTAAPAPAPAVSPEQETLRQIVNRHLGRPYVWGAAGLKSYDCSGFVWRVMTERGLFLKRTTARKYFMCLPKLQQKAVPQFGDIVFFSNLKHCGIVNDQDTFFHAQRTKGTNLSNFKPYWKRLISGYRAMPPVPAERQDLQD